MSKENERFHVVKSVIFTAFGLGLLVSAQNASAVPSFARQSGMACAACHTVFPKLTAFGRMFKLNGYTITGLQQIEQKENKSSPGLKVNAISPMSAMIQAAFTNTKNPGSNTENNHIAFPTALSLYYAGEISDKMGAFIQATMDDASSSFSFDMADMRYANTTTMGSTSVTYGMSLDNMSGMEDVWNTTPAWTYPYLAISPGEGDSPAVNSLMGAGLGGYAMVANHWYAYLGTYEPMSDQKVMNPGTAMAMGNPHANAPYWRLAWQGNMGNSYLEVGTYGTQEQVYGTTAASSDKFNDTAFDLQYELSMGEGDQLNAHVVSINESQNLAASNSASPSQSMNQTRADVAYISGGHYQYQLGYFNTKGSSGAYTFDGMHAAAYGGDSNGYIAEFDYLPWENTKFSLQYFAYSKYNGASGTAASDNNSLVGNVWFMW